MGGSENGNYLAHRVVIELTRTFDLLEDVLNRHFARFGLSPVKFNALVQLMYYGDVGLSLSELGEKMMVTGANITGLIDRLERDGLVYRDNDPRDRRIVRAKITPRAKDLLRQIMPAHSKFVGTVLSVLSPGEKESFIDFLVRLQAGLEKF